MSIDPSMGQHAQRIDEGPFDHTHTLGDREEDMMSMGQHAQRIDEGPFDHTHTLGDREEDMMSIVPIYPGLQFYDADFAKLRMRLDLFDDFIVACQYEDGEAGDSYLVDPADVGPALAGGMSLGTGLLPPNTIFWKQAGSQQCIGVWLPSQARNVSVSGEKNLVPLPAMIFVGQGDSYQVWAIAGGKFPDDPETRLYHAPVPNMGRDICRGNVDFPEAGPDTIMAAVALFFESEFNNHLAGGKSRKYPDSILEMWREIGQSPGSSDDDNSAIEYPEDDLVPTSMSLGRLIEEVG